MNDCVPLRRKEDCKVTENTVPESSAGELVTRAIRKTKGVFSTKEMCCALIGRIRAGTVVSYVL